MRFGKIKQQPQVRKALYAAKRIRIPVFRHKYNLSFGTGNAPRLPRNAELVAKIRADVRNRLYFYGFVLHFLPFLCGFANLLLSITYRA